MTLLTVVMGQWLWLLGDADTARRSLAIADVPEIRDRERGGEGDRQNKDIHISESNMIGISLIIYTNVSRADDVRKDEHLPVWSRFDCIGNSEIVIG